MKTTILITLLICGGSAVSQSPVTGKSKLFMEMITEENLQSSLHYVASDYFNGREGGSVHEKITASYLATCYRLMNIPGINGSAPGLGPSGAYFQTFEFTERKISKQSQNVIAVLEGSDPILKKEAILIIAHYDHLGCDTALKGDQIYNGAADDGSGTVGLLHIAKSFASAKAKGMGPKRSIIFFSCGLRRKRGTRF